MFLLKLPLSPWAFSLMLALLAHPLLAQAQAPKPALPTTATGWQAAAQRDIAAAYLQTVDNHPGIHDPFNPSFRKRLDGAKREALALANRIDSAAGYRTVFERFNTLIKDGHAGVFATLENQPLERWPGFVTVWRGQDLWVYGAEEGGPTKGSRVVTCDGQAVRDVILRNVFQYLGRADEAGNWWTRARSVFVDRGNPFARLPARCVFEHESRQQTLNLVWRATNASFEAWRGASFNGDELPVGWSEPRPGLQWIAMPTFEPDEGQRSAYRALNERMAAQRDALLKADAVVLDLRHNQGGSSEWSQQIAETLWGKGRVERRMAAYLAKTEVWWRTSAGNARHMLEAAKQVRAEQRTEMADVLEPLAQKLLAAANKGETFFVEKDAPTALADPLAELPYDPPAFTRPVYVIVPGQCASACLDALDVFTRFDKVTLVGAPSSADSTYMEVRTQAVPSGMAVTIIPTKLLAYRPRAGGEVYPAAIEMKSLDWSTAAFAARIAEDLARRRN